MPSQPALVIFGPTASGKTALAVRLAKQHGAATIINADSMQVYKGLPVLTACPTEVEKQGVPHRLFEWLDAAQPCSVALWLEAVRIAIYETWQAGRLPIIVGGTGMYIKALLHGIAPIPGISSATRQQVRGMERAAAYAYLQTHDPVMAEKLEPGDSQRIARAVEVHLQTGKSLAHWQAQPPIPPVPQARFHTYTLSLERDLLYARCNQRLERMMEEGALDELEALLARNLPGELPAMRAVPIPELARYLRGEWPLPEALEKAKQATRNYAKRQITWQRHQLADAPAIAYPYDPVADSLLKILQNRA